MGNECDSRALLMFLTFLTLFSCQRDICSPRVLLNTLHKYVLQHLSKIKYEAAVL